MSFLFPGFLLAFAALSIPILIHLFNFRKFKKVWFTNVRFLREVKMDTQSRSRLKHLLVLACRILAVTFIVLAFARPFIPSANSTTHAARKIISVYIDNSFSMESVGMNGQLIDEAKRKAHEIAGAYTAGDRFQLLTNDFEVRHQRLVNKEEFESMVDEVKTSASVRKTSEVIARIKDVKENEEKNADVSHIICLLSDFQKTTSDFSELHTDSTENIYLVPVASQKQSNIYVDTCYFASPYVQVNVPAALYVRIRNVGQDDVQNIPVKLTVNGIQKSLASVDVSAKGTVIDTLNFTATAGGWQQAEVSVTDYPVTFDDKYFLSFFISDRLNILEVNGTEPNRYLDALFGHDAYFTFDQTPENRIDYSSLGKYQLIILNELKSPSSGLAQELNRFLEKGGSVIIFPHTDADIPVYNNFLNALNAPSYSQAVTAEERIASLETANILFKDVFENKGSGKNEIMDLPVVKKYFPLSSRMNEESIMLLQNRSSVLSQVTSGKGKLFLSAVPVNADFSGLPVHALFVPLMHRIALLSSGIQPVNAIIGHDQQAEINSSAATGAIGGERVYHLINKPESVDVIAQEKVIAGKPFVSFPQQIYKAGNYELHDGDKLVSVISFNYNRTESDLASMSNSELETVIASKGIANITAMKPGNENLSVMMQHTSEGVHLWKWCIILALLFLAAEILLIRFFRIQPVVKSTMK
jgi:hypothetical protein